MRKYTVLSSLALLFGMVTATAQYNTVNPGSSLLKKGLYKNYQEFVNNAPSVTDDFTVMPLFLNKKDTGSFIAAAYRFTDTLKDVHQVWGFCDGESVFINSSRSFAIPIYWKLISLGHYPFFKGSSNAKDIGGAGIGALIRFAGRQIISFKPRNLMLQIITDKGRFKEPDIAYIKKLLTGNPGLLADFNKEAGPYEQYDNPNADVYEPEEAYEEKLKIITRYLILLNAKNPG